MDKLDEHLRRGGITSEFVAQMGGIHTATDTGQIKEFSEQSHELENHSSILTLMSAIANRLENSNIFAPLSDYEALERAYKNGWGLSTSGLAFLLGLSPKTLISHKNLSRNGFVFTRSGRNGIEIAWKVSKSK